MQIYLGAHEIVEEALYKNQMKWLINGLLKMSAKLQLTFEYSIKA